MKCPGQDSRFWGTEAIMDAPCPQCGKIVEFFRDEPSRRCPQCRHKFVNPRMDFGCAAYCRFAEECLGSLPPELMAQRESLLKDRVALEVKRRLGRNFKALARSMRAARYAEEIFRRERLNDPAVILATYLHVFSGCDGGTQGDDRELRTILETVVPRRELVDAVLEVLSSGAKRPEDLSFNEKVFADALALTGYEDARRESPAIERPALFTPVAADIATEIERNG